MRIVVFTGNAHLESTPWWPIVLETPGLERLLVCRLVYARTRADVLRRLRGNIRKHGWIFVPYRILVLVGAVLGKLRRGRAATVPAAVPAVPVDAIEAVNLHDPETLARVRDWKPDLGLSLGAPVLKPSLFTIPARGTVNLHLGKVPDYRGAPPGFWELYTGAGEVGATVHWINEGLDTGDVIACGTAPIYPADTPARVEARAVELGVRIFAGALPRVAAGPVAGTPQPAGGRTFRFPTLRQRFALWSRLAARRWRRRLSPRALAKTVVSVTMLWVWRPLRDIVRSLARRHPVRVFTFHRVTDLCRDGMTIAPGDFDRQLEYLATHHEVVTLDRAIALATSGARLARPVAALTFDDGYRSVFTAARPAMAERRIPGCAFVCTDLAGTERRLPHDAQNPVRDYLDVMSWGELKRLRDEGWTIGGHTATHARLSACPPDALRPELAGPIAALRSRLGLDTVAMAYPFGQENDINEAAARMVRETGYCALFSDFGGENSAGASPFELRRIEIGGDHEPMSWKLAAHGIELRRARLRLAGMPRG